MYQRHNAIAKELAMIANSVGTAAQYNAPDGHAAGPSGVDGVYHDFRPGDLNLLSGDICIDVTIFSPLSVHTQKAAATHPGLMAAQQSHEKHKLYDPVISLHAKSFKVFAVDVAGFTNSEAIDIIRDLAVGYARTHEAAFSHAYSLMLRRVSFLIMKQFVLQIHSYQQHHYTHSVQSTS